MHSLHCLNAIRKALHPEYYLGDDKHDLLEQVKSIHIGKFFQKLLKTGLLKDLRTLHRPDSAADPVRWRPDAINAKTMG